MEIFLLLIRLFLFGVFALAGIGKLLDLTGAIKSVKDFGLPEIFAKPVAYFLPFIELTIAILLLFVSTSWFGSVVGLLLLLAFVGAMIYQVAKGNAPDCHCFGQIHSEPVGKSSIFRNVGFVLLALFLTAQGRGNQGLSLAQNEYDLTQTILILAILMLAAVALFYLKQILENQAKILRRIELLELIANDGVPVNRDDAGNPDEGLPIGAPFPDFELPDAEGKIATLNNLIAKTKPMLLFFVGPECVPCNAMLPEICEWRDELSDKINFVFISKGRAEDNIEKFGGDWDIVPIIQKEREVANVVGAKWTPTALFVNSEGMIASHLAAGDVSIRELVGKVKTEDIQGEFVFVEPASHNDHKLKIGEQVPEFTANGLNGGEITHNNFVGKKTLVIFWSLTCQHCLAMKDEIKEWEAEKTPYVPNLIMISEGGREPQLEIGFKSPVIMDNDRELSTELGMINTPSAILVNEKGIITTETGIGSKNIWSLIGRRITN
ncbi:MAG: MauE/DoxX family redox-associated membrane protein [Blastocatellia bacterium]